MVLQYPDILTVKSKATEGSMTDGIWTPGVQGVDIIQTGRYEPTTLDRELFTIDGNEVKLKGIFYCPLNTPEIQTGSLIESIVNKESESVVTKIKVLFFDRGEIACRIYL